MSVNEKAAGPPRVVSQQRLLGRPPIAVQVQVRDTAPPFFPAHPLVTPATMASAEPKKRIAGILTWYTVGSHSDVLVGKFLPGRGIPADDGFHE
eukprot:COSAG01_NODE_45627_length_407_cov_4.909091_1_plen_93_part_01